MRKNFTGRFLNFVRAARKAVAFALFDLAENFQAIGRAICPAFAGGSDPAVIDGVDTLIFSMDGICADLETGMEPQSMSGSMKPEIKEFKDRKGNVITVAVYDNKGEMTIPVIFYGGTLPDNGTAVTLALVPAPFAGDWWVMGVSIKGENEGAVSCDVHLRRWLYVAAP